MIDATLETATVSLGKDSLLAIVLSNSGHQVCRNIVFRLRLPPEIVLLRGCERVELERLEPGASHRIDLWVRPCRAGDYCVTSPNFSFRDASGRSYRKSGWRARVVINEPLITPAERAKAHAQALERAQRWQDAWPLYVESGQIEQSWACLNQAIQTLVAHSRHAEAAEQYLAWAQVVSQQSDRFSIHRNWSVAALGQAAEWFAQLGRVDLVNQCRDLVAQLTGQPMLAVRMVFPVDVAVVQGKPTLISIEVTNRGYGPARKVKLSLSGLIEHPDKWEIFDLLVGKTDVWNDACVIPSHHGHCVVELRTEAIPYGGGEPVIASFRGVIQAQEAGIMEQIGRRKDAVVHLQIDTYVASGASSVTVKDSAVVARAPLINNSEQRLPTEANRPEDLGRGYCAQCSEPAHPRQKFCSRCGASLAA